MADQVVVMRDGRVEQAGTPAEVYSRPSTRFVAGFIGASNMFEGQVEASGPTSKLRTTRGWTMSIPGTHAVGSRVTAMVRPEAVRLCSDRLEADANEVPVTVERVIHHGASSRYHLRTQTGEPLVATVQDGNGADWVNRSAVAHCKAASMHILPPAA